MRMPTNVVSMPYSMSECASHFLVMLHKGDLPPGRRRRSSVTQSRRQPSPSSLQRGRTAGRVAALASTLSCLPFLTKASTSAFVHSLPAGSRASLQRPRRADDEAGQGSYRFNEAEHPFRWRRARPRTWSPIEMASKWDDEGSPEDAFDRSRMSAQGQHVINWYPGHIAKAERELQDYLKMVDVVIEVRDCRIPAATTHQMVPKWVGNRRLIVVMNRVDMAPAAAVGQWKRYLVNEGGLRADNRAGNVPAFFVDSKKGKGVHEIKKAALKAGARMNARRMRRGMNPRSVRVAVIGFPNVGKSALINRLIGKSVAKSMNVPGVTKKLNWVRLGGTDTKPEHELELLDSPGIIPARQEDQNQALKLAICNDIGQASYDTQVVAAKMVDQLVEAAVQFPGYVSLGAVEKRYGIDPRRHTGEEYLYLVAKKMYFGEQNSAADRLLGDFRKGFLGHLALEAPPSHNAKHNRLPLKHSAEREGAGGPSSGTVRGGARWGEGAGEALEDMVFGAAAKEAREFVGTGDFEGW